MRDIQSSLLRSNYYKSLLYLLLFSAVPLCAMLKPYSFRKIRHSAHVRKHKPVQRSKPAQNKISEFKQLLEMYHDDNCHCILKITELILEDCSPDIAKEDGKTALMLVGYNNHNHGLLKFLLEKGATLHKTDLEGRNSLMLAVGDFYKMRFLIDAGIDLNHRDRRKQTALHYAVAKDDFEATKLLLAKGVDPNAQDADGNAPLMLQPRPGKTALIRLLLAYGTDLELKNNKGETLIGFAAAWPELAGLLEKKKIL